MTSQDYETLIGALAATSSGPRQQGPERVQ